MKISTDSINRLSLGIMEKHQCSPEEAIVKLRSLNLNLDCGDEIKNSLPLQAALVTAVNTAKRAFLGSLSVRMPGNTPCLLRWPGDISLNEVVTQLGGTIIDELPSGTFTLCFGLPGTIDQLSMRVVCNNWQVGVLVQAENPEISSTGDIPTAGIFAGAYSVFLAFLRSTGIHLAACDESKGISLWRPDLHWLDGKAKGPHVEFLPAQYWLLGLGHLGQAYLWNIGLLPYASPGQVKILLQDDDKVVEANWSAGLLSEKSHQGIMKTRLCAQWLEKRGFLTSITERRFNQHTRRIQDEPFLALCGFDSGPSRLPLEDAGYDLIVESGLGNSLPTFDMISLHTFPGAGKTPTELWGDIDPAKIDINETIYNILRKAEEGECGIIPLTIAGKAVSASFVGACSGAMVVAELLRGLHGGMRYDKIMMHLRDLDNRKALLHKSGGYLYEHSRNGFVQSATRTGLV